MSAASAEQPNNQLKKIHRNQKKSGFDSGFF
jgi:hypothetical protein